MPLTFADWKKRPNTSKVLALSLDAVKADLSTKTYYLASEPGGIVFGSQFYEDDLHKFPRFIRSMQNVFGGASLNGGSALISYGKLTINNHRGTYDEVLDGTWNLVGKAVLGKIGGKELDFVDYQNFLAGIVVDVRAGSNKRIEITIADLLTTMVNQFQAAGTYTGKVHTLIKAALTGAGLAFPSDFNSTMWTAFETDVNYDVSVTLANPVTVWDYIGQLTKGLLVFYGMGRDGKFEIGEFKAPSGTAVETVSYLDISKGAPKIELLSVFWKTQIVWDNAGAPTVETVSDATIKNAFPDALETGEIQTAITTLADAQTERDRRFNLFKVRRKLLKTFIKVIPFERHLNHVVTVDVPQRGINSEDFRIIALKDDVLKAECETTFFN